MKDRLIYGLLAGITAPLLVVLLFWWFRFNYLSLEEFIQQMIFLKVQFKVIAVGIFFADLGLFYLFLRLNKNNASKGVIMAVFSLLLFVSGLFRFNLSPPRREYLRFHRVCPPKRTGSIWFPLERRTYRGGNYSTGW